MSSRALRIGRLIELGRLLGRAWDRAYSVGNWREYERIQVRSRAVSVALAEAVGA